MVTEVDRLLDGHSVSEVAVLLNESGVQPSIGDMFTTAIVEHLRRAYGLADRFTRLRRDGLLTVQEVATHLGVHTQTVKRWQRDGRLASVAYNDKGQRLYPTPGADAPVKFAWQLARGRKPPVPR